MGLFSKGNPYEAAALELEESQRRRDRTQSMSSLQKTAMNPPKAPPAAPAPALAAAPALPTLKSESPIPEASKLTYGIEDVIQLMRDLPDNKKEMVIQIVQKTLVSAKIDINGILEKAANKIESFQSKNDRLRAEIRELEEMIIQKKSDVDRLRRDIEETQQVRQSFEQVYLRGSKSAQLTHFDEDAGSTRAGFALAQVSG